MLIADASGHGAPAAVLMAVAHSIAHTRPEAPDRPGEFLTYLNAHLTRHYTRPTGNFMTAFYAVFDPRERDPDLRERRAQPAALLRAADGRDGGAQPCPALPARHQAGRSVPRTDRPASCRAIRSCFFTDGVIEAVNADGDVFGSERIDAALGTCPPTRGRLHPERSCAN